MKSTYFLTIVGVLFFISTFFYTSALAQENHMTEQETNEMMMEILKKQYGAKETCPSETKEEIEYAIKTTWSKMSQSVMAGDQDTALLYFAVLTRDEYRRRLFSDDGKRFTSVLEQTKELVVDKIFEGKMAECGAIRTEKSGTYSYPVKFIKDLDCVWRVQGF